MTAVFRLAYCIDADSNFKYLTGLIYFSCLGQLVNGVLFFFQAEDGIRDHCVTGVQTCALPISSRRRHTRSLCDWSSDVCSSDRSEEHTSELQSHSDLVCRLLLEIGRASCRERV